MGIGADEVRSVPFVSLASSNTTPSPSPPPSPSFCGILSVVVLLFLHFSPPLHSLHSYGDISPGTQTGRFVGCIYLLVTVAATGKVLGSLAGRVVEKKRRQAMEAILQKKVTLKDFAHFDIDGDGKVEKLEYALQKLVLMGLLDRKEMERVEQEFERMDADGSGTITMEDLDIHLKASAILKTEAAKKAAVAVTTKNAPVAAIDESELVVAMEDEMY